MRAMKPARAGYRYVRPQIRIPLMSSPLPKHLWILLTVYFAASLLHFAHNAEFIAFYPNMPEWLTREKVYLAWLGVSSIGVAALVVLRFGWYAVGALLLAAYGSMGLDGLGHYTLALCSEHTLTTNLTIWFEVASGVILAAAAVFWLRTRHV